MNKYSVIIASLMINLTYSNNILKWANKNKFENLAIIKKPVVDFTGNSLQEEYNLPKDNLKEKYNNLGFSPEKGRGSCPRVCQLLANEIVEIVEENGPEVKCKIYSLFYEKPDGEIIDAFWTLKENIELINNFKNKVLSFIPAPYDYTQNPIAFNKNILTLSYPYKIK